MLRYHDINELEGKVASSLLNSYKLDYKNPAISSIIAGFHRVYGLRNEGLTMSLEIVNNIRDNTQNLWDRSIMVWNLYILAREYIDDGMYDEAMGVIKRAEKNWSRDVIMGDEIGVYHVSWIEQIWQRQAEIYLLMGDKDNFDKIIEKILASRFDLFDKAEEITGESILNDRCTYNCFELMAFERKRNDIVEALNLIKNAIMIKAGLKLNEEFNSLFKFEDEPSDKLHKLFDLSLKYFYSLSDSPYDNMSYLYCKSCRYYNSDKRCNLHNLDTDSYKSCSQYRN